MEPSRGRDKDLAPLVSSHAKSAEPESCLYSWLQNGLVAQLRLGHRDTAPHTSINPRLFFPQGPEIQHTPYKAS